MYYCLHALKFIVYFMYFWLQTAMSLINVFFVGVLLMFGYSSTVTATSCQSKLPSGVDPSICLEIETVVYTMRYTLRKIDVKVSSKRNYE